MKHVLFVLDYYLPHRGGVENVFENVITRLLKKGYKISVLTSRFDTNLLSVETHGDLQIYRTGRDRLSFLFAAIIKGVQILKNNPGISIIHASTYGGAIPASILGKLFKKKVILTVHEIFGKLWNVYKGRGASWLYRLFERIIFWFSYDVYHCVSRYTMNSLRTYYGVPDHKLRMIYNGVDYDFWDPEKVSHDESESLRKKHGWENKFVILYYGHAGKSKGIDYLIEAMPGILALDERVVMVFNLIESRRTAAIRAQIADGGWQKNKIQVFDGMLKEELRTLIASVDCVVAPSLSEGFGSVHTETCAMKIPLITTNVASIPEVVSGNVVMINPGSAEEIVKGVKSVKGGNGVNGVKKSSTTSWSHSFYKGGQSDAVNMKRFSWEETVEEIEKLY